MSTTLTVGLLVEHTVWGRGKVLKVVPPHFVAYFPSLSATPDGPRRKLQLAALQISVAAVQSDPRLDLVSMTPKGTEGAKRNSAMPKVLRPTLNSLDQAITWFERTYPKRFNDPRLEEMELGYKREAHKMFVRYFGRGRGQALLDANDLPTISKGLGELYHATNIPARFEIMAANDGLKDGAAAARLLKAVLDLVGVPDANSFAHLVDAVSTLPAPAGGSKVLTWPNVTILPFLANPKKFMVLKPAITKKMARRVGFDLIYSSPPTWHTYEALLRMSAMLLDRLSSLGARDFIDVQSFIWVTQELE